MKFIKYSSRFIKPGSLLKTKLNPSLNRFSLKVTSDKPSQQKLWFVIISGMKNVRNLSSVGVTTLFFSFRNHWASSLSARKGSNKKNGFSCWGPKTGSRRLEKFKVDLFFNILPDLKLTFQPFGHRRRHKYFPPCTPRSHQTVLNQFGKISQP